jgi:hypothetical protein
MIKRFWPLLILIVIVIMAAIILPAAAGLLTRVEKQFDPNTYDTILWLDTPSYNFPDDVKAGEPFEVYGYLYYCHYEIFQQYEVSVSEAKISLYEETGVLPVDETPQESLINALAAGVIFPLPDRRVVISTEVNFAARYHNKPDVSTHTTQNVHTDQDGYFQTTIQIDNIKQWHRWVAAQYYGETKLVTLEGAALPVMVTYKKSDDKLPRSKIQMPSSLWQQQMEGPLGPTSVFTTGAIVFAILFLAVIIYSVFYYRKQIRAWLRKRKAKGAVPEPASIKTPAVSTSAIQEISTGDSRVEIMFPQIEKPLPPVWGIGELLVISSRALVEKAENEINSRPQIKTTEHALDITLPDFTSVQIEHTFDVKGEKDINLSFGGDTDEKISGTRKIRIVDYREEIVELFNRLIDSLSLKGIAVDRMMTAREIEMKLTAQYLDISSDTMKTVVKGFEYANYSLYSVARKIYVDMYLAVEEIEERVKNA